jgi:hypothetical protein
MISEASLRYGKVGLPTHVTISLENDVVTITDKSQKVLLHAPLRELTDVGQSFGLIAFKVNDKYYSLEFISMTSKFFGSVCCCLKVAPRRKNGAKNSNQEALSLKNNLCIPPRSLVMAR